MPDREFRLLVALCRRAFGGGSGEVCGSGGPANWQRLLQLARRHRVQALAWHGLSAAHADMPTDIAEHFAADSIAIVEANLRAAVECARLQRQFVEAGIDLLFLKGLTAGALAYPNPFLKMGWDIDVLIEPAMVLAAAALLRSSGYVPATPASASDALLERWHRNRKESVWRHPGSGIYVELHTRLADHPSLLPDLGMQSPRQMVKITDQIVLPTLNQDHLFAYLCVHGASSAWFRLKWITDLAAMLHRLNIDGIDRLYQHSQQLGAGHAAGQALLLAHRLYDVSLSPRLSRRLETNRSDRWLARLAQREMADPREPTEHFLGTAGIRLSQLALMPGWKFLLSELNRQAREIMGARLRWG